MLFARAEAADEFATAEAEHVPLDGFAEVRLPREDPFMDFFRERPGEIRARLQPLGGVFGAGAGAVHKGLHDSNAARMIPVTKLATKQFRSNDTDVSKKANISAHKNDRAARIYRRLKGMRGVDESELWQHALFFAMSPQERCRFSLKTARSVLSLRRSVTKA